MHELGVMQSVMDIVFKSAKEAGATRVTRIKIKAGEMEGLVADSMQFNFEHLRMGTIASEAELVIEEVPIIVECSTCGEQSHVAPFEVVYCPKCMNFTVEMLSGKELFVESIEME